ncbi:MAG: GumC family protein [Acidobacteriota bacterium]
MIEERPLPWQEIVETLFRRKGMIIGCAILGVAIAFAATTLTPPLYRAEARILLTEQATGGPREEGMSSSQIQAELAYLRSPTLVRAVLEDYAANDRPLTPEETSGESLTRTITELPKSLRGSLHTQPPASPIDNRIRVVIDRIEVERISDTYVVKVAYTDTDPEWAAAFVDDLVDHHVNRIAAFNEENNPGTFFNKQKNLLAVRWEEAKTALNLFRRQYGSNLLAGDRSHLRRVLADLESDRVRTGTEVLELEAKVTYLIQALDERPEQVAAESRSFQNPALQFLTERLLELEIERSELLIRYTPESTAVRNVERQIVEARKLAEETASRTQEETMTALNPARQTLDLELVKAQAQLTAAQARVTALDQQIDDYRGKLARLESSSAELDRLSNDVESAKTAYLNYLTKEEEARLNASLSASGIVNVSVFEKAAVPLEAQPSKRGLKLILGLIGGLVVGVLLAFARDWLLDPTVKSSAEAHRTTGVPVIGEIPR